MSLSTSIEWATDTANYWHGCTKVSPACQHCYAESIDRRKLHSTDLHWGPGVPRLDMRPSARRTIRSIQDHLAKLPLNAPRPRVFVNSMSDWLDAEAPIQWLADLLLDIHLTPGADFLLLSKRPHLWRERIQAVAHLHDSHPAGHLAQHWLDGTPPSNAWVGTTVEDQDRVSERVPHLLRIPATIRFLSCEPLLAPVDLTAYLWVGRDNPDATPWNHQPTRLYSTNEELHWVIGGYESGAGARPRHPDIIRFLRDQCADTHTPFFFKQWGTWIHKDLAPDDAHAPLDDTGQYLRLGKKLTGNLLDGQHHLELPLGSPGTPPSSAS